MRMRLVMMLLGMLFVLSACGKNSDKENAENSTILLENNTVAETEQEKIAENHFEGVYAAYDINEPMLFVQKNEGGTYSIQIGIYRLVQLDNCVGVENGNGLDFSTTEWGEEQEITGTITLDDNVATVTLYAPWSDTWFKDVNEYKYYKYGL